jgi:hypothetical protein
MLKLVVKDLEFPRLSELQLKRKASHILEDKEQGIDLIRGVKRVRKNSNEGEQISNYFERATTKHAEDEVPSVANIGDKNASRLEARELETEANVVTPTVEKASLKNVQKDDLTPSEKESTRITDSNTLENKASGKDIENRNPVPPAQQQLEVTPSNAESKTLAPPPVAQDTVREEHPKTQGQLDTPVVSADTGDIKPPSNRPNPALQVTPSDNITPTRNRVLRDSVAPDLDVLLQRCNDILRTNAPVPDRSQSIPTIQPARTISNDEVAPQLCGERYLRQNLEANHPVENGFYEGGRRDFPLDANHFSEGLSRPSIRDVAAYPVEREVDAGEGAYHGDFGRNPEAYIHEYVLTLIMLMERRISHEYHHESSAIPLVQMYGSAGDFPRLFIDREFGDEPPDVVGQQFWETNVIPPQFRENNALPYGSFHEDDGALSDEDTDFDEEICISEPPLEAAERDDARPPDEREWWSTRRRWF